MDPRVVGRGRVAGVLSRMVFPGEVSCDRVSDYRGPVKIRLTRGNGGTRGTQGADNPVRSGGDCGVWLSGYNRAYLLFYRHEMSSILIPIFMINLVRTFY